MRALRRGISGLNHCFAQGLRPRIPSDVQDTLSTGEAISVMNSGLALAAYFGDGSLRAHDLAAGLTGAVVKDPRAGLRGMAGIPGNRSERARRLERFVPRLPGGGGVVSSPNKYDARQLSSEDAGAALGLALASAQPTAYAAAWIEGFLSGSGQPPAPPSSPFQPARPVARRPDRRHVPRNRAPAAPRLHRLQWAGVPPASGPGRARRSARSYSGSSRGFRLGARTTGATDAAGIAGLRVRQKRTSKKPGTRRGATAFNAGRTDCAKPIVMRSAVPRSRSILPGQCSNSERRLNDSSEMLRQADARSSMTGDRL